MEMGRVKLMTSHPVAMHDSRLSEGADYEHELHLAMGSLHELERFSVSYGLFASEVMKQNVVHKLVVQKVLFADACVSTETNYHDQNYKREALLLYFSFWVLVQE